MRVTRRERLTALAPGEDGRFRVWSFAVEASVDGRVDPATGMVVNLVDMKRDLRRRVVEPWNGRLLDGTGGAPDLRTPERIARGVWDALEGCLGGCALRRVRLREAAGAVYECRGGMEVDVTRSYEFSAAHRLHAEGLSEEENRRVFGKCNNPAGHGHNYVLEVTVRGPLDGRGELLEEAAFDRIVHAEVVDRWDHRHLNEDVPEFRGVNPTAEEIARLAWERLAAPLHGAAPAARLHRVKLRETPRNHVEYYGPEPEEGAQG